MPIFSKQNTGWNLCKFCVKVLVSSKNVMYMQNNYIVVAWFYRCKGVEYKIRLEI